MEKLKYKKLEVMQPTIKSWGCASRLLANIFPFLSNSPTSLCESLLGPVSFSDSIDNACLSSLVIRHHAEVSALIFSFIVFSVGQTNTRGQSSRLAVYSHEGILFQLIPVVSRIFGRSYKKISNVSQIFHDNVCELFTDIEHFETLVFRACKYF